MSAGTAIFATGPGSGGAPRFVSVRTCVGCRQAAPATALVRLVLVERQLVVPVGRTRPPGRGAWLHPAAACVAAAARTRAFDRAFRAPVGQVDVAGGAGRRHGRRVPGGHALTSDSRLQTVVRPRDYVRWR